MAKYLDADNGNANPLAIVSEGDHRARGVSD